MNVLSLFDGISCARLALERAGIPVSRYFASEIDKWAIKVSASNWPDIEQVGDVRGVSAADLPKIDLVCGGSPCQGFSVAGRGLNFDDPRSALFFEYVRVLEEVRRVNPDVLFLLENVPMKTEWRDIITKHLGVPPVEIDAALVSAQGRKRLFWTNIAAEPYGLFGDYRSKVSQPDDKGILLPGILQPIEEVDERYWLSEAAMKRIERKRQMGYSPHKDGAQTCSTGSKLGITNGLTILKCDRFGVPKKMQDKGSTQMAGIRNATNSRHMDLLYVEQRGRGKNAGGAKGLGGKTPSVSANSLENNNFVSGYRRFTPVEVERLFTLPDGYTSCVSDSQRYRLMGNGWVVDVVAHIFGHIK